MSTQLFIRASKSENSSKTIKIPVDQTMSFVKLSLLQSMFPGATGLKYRTTSDSKWHTLKAVDDKVQLPSDFAHFITGRVYFPIYVELACNDLIAMYLSSSLNEADVRKYFEKFGKLTRCSLKLNPNKTSKGMAIICFKDYKDQCAALKVAPHVINGKESVLRIAIRKEEKNARKEAKKFPNRNVEQTANKQITKSVSGLMEMRLDKPNTSIPHLKPQAAMQNHQQQHHHQQAKNPGLTLTSNTPSLHRQKQSQAQYSRTTQSNKRKRLSENAAFNRPPLLPPPPPAPAPQPIKPKSKEPLSLIVSMFEPNMEDLVRKMVDQIKKPTTLTSSFTVSDIHMSMPKRRKVVLNENKENNVTP